ncbi:von Willebrand factor type A domain-containing protein [Thermodesulfobacteriota bacterium]
MENEDLKRFLNKLPIPEPGEEAKDRAVRSALAEFRNQAEKKNKYSKGFSWLGRLKGKKLKGGPFMNRPIAITAGIAVGIIVFAITLSPQFTAYRTRSTKYDDVRVATLKEGQVSSTKPSESESLSQGGPEKPLAKVEEALDSATLMKPKSAKPAIPAPSLDEGSEMTQSIPSKTSKRVKKAERDYTRSNAIQKEIAANFVPSPGEKGGQMREDQTYVGRDKFENFTPNPVKLVSDEPVSTFSIDVDTVSYAFIRRALNNGYLPQKDSVRIEELINYFDYDYPLPEDRAAPFKPSVAVFPTPWNSDTKILHIGIKGYDIVADKKPKSNLVFLIDVSGSMASQDKLPLLKNSLRMLVDTLEPDDSVAIVVYAGAAGTVLERTKVSDKGKILVALERLEAGGSTAGGEGISLAYSLAEADMDPEAVNRVILATDGDFNVGIRNPEVLEDFVERKRKNGVYLSVLGFGQGNYNDALMQKLAQNGNGNAAYIDNLNEARKVLVDEAAGTLFTIAKDVKVQVEFNPTTISEYRLIGYETRLLKREDFRNDKVDAGDIGSGHSVTAIYEITPLGSKGRLIDDLRYGSDESPESSNKQQSSEYAFLKIRYKLPDEKSSREITTAIDKSKEYTYISDVSGECRFAGAVAAFGQLLKDDSHINQFNYDDVINLARGSIGDDFFGYRTEFLNLVRLAKTAAPMGDR